MDIHSRGALPRLSLMPLESVLNAWEGGSGEDSGLAWVANELFDSGPMLRLER